MRRSVVAELDTSREQRTQRRRLQNALAMSDLPADDAFTINQLRGRQKKLRFDRSGIHDWGVFAMEPIEANDVVIEYIGEYVRTAVADLREQAYEASGLGSSYLFRVDAEWIIDATKKGNMARFINHSCDPNCMTRVVMVNGRKRIVIYSKRRIEPGEELVYDYKFPLEDVKIPCLCGTRKCRGFLN